MPEQKLEITTTGKYKNIQLKPRKGVGGLTAGNFIVVEKRFAEGKAFPSTQYKNKDGSPQVSYACAVKYEGEDVGFWLNEAEHQLYAAIGGQGDKVKITLNKIPVVNPKSGVEMLIARLEFELA